MLVAIDKSWAICSPMKTGFQSLAATLAPASFSCDGKAVAELVGGCHDCEWDGSGKRILVVREPLDRFASLYWYSLSSGRDPSFRGADGIAGWVGRFLASAKHKNNYDEWTISQSEMANEFKPDIVVRFEGGLNAVCVAVGVHAEVGKRNVTDFKKSFDDTFGGIDAMLLQGILDWAEPDRKAFYQ